MGYFKIFAFFDPVPRTVPIRVVKVVWMVVLVKVKIGVLIVVSGIVVLVPGRDVVHRVGGVVSGLAGNRLKWWIGSRNG